MPFFLDQTIIRCPLHVCHDSSFLVDRGRNCICTSCTHNIVPVLTLLIHMQQLQHQATEFVSDGVVPAAVWGVFQRDSMLDDDLSRSLTDALQPLKDIPEVDKDWHPGSEDQVCSPLMFLACCFHRCCHVLVPCQPREWPYEAHEPSNSSIRSPVFHPLPSARQRCQTCHRIRFRTAVTCISCPNKP